MPIFAGLIKSNLIHLLGIIVYGLTLIGLTALGYKVIASVVGFKPAIASEKQHIFMGIITLGLVIGFSLIIAVTSYESSPEVVMASGARIAGAGGGRGGCGSKPGGCGGAAKPPVHQAKPVPQAKAAPTPVETPSQ